MIKVKKKMEVVEIGDFVRSYEFEHLRDDEGERACYVDGWVVAKYRHGEWVEEYKQYARYGIVAIRVVRDVTGGRHVRPGREGMLVFPPENGTETLFGDVTDGVRVLSKSR